MQIQPSYFASTSIVLILPFSVSINFPNPPQPLKTPKFTSMLMLSLTLPIVGAFIEVTYPISYSMHSSFLSSSLSQLIIKLEIKIKTKKIGILIS